MDEQYVFFPPNRRGVIFHLAAITILTLVGAWGLWQAFHTDVGPVFLLYLLPFLAAIPLVPFLIYRLSSLENASYTLERDSIRLRWGLRSEVIPMVNVQWVHPATDLGRALPLPRFRWPGAVSGTRRYPGGTMDIEYMASQRRNLLVIATPEKLYAISPANTDNFLLTYQHFTEMGSLLPPTARSVYPTVVVTRLWETRLSQEFNLIWRTLKLQFTHLGQYIHPWHRSSFVRNQAHRCAAHTDSQHTLDAPACNERCRLPGQSFTGNWFIPAR